MKKVLLSIGLLLGAISFGYAAQLDYYQPGYRTIDGSQLNKMVDVVNQTTAGVGKSYVIARGETALDGSNPTPVTTGLTTIVSCTASIKLTTAPGVGTSVITYGTSSDTLNLYGWKVTASGDATLIASTGTETIGWVCVGTK